MNNKQNLDLSKMFGDLLKGGSNYLETPWVQMVGCSALPPVDNKLKSLMEAAKSALTYKALLGGPPVMIKLYNYNYCIFNKDVLLHYTEIENKLANLLSLAVKTEERNTNAYFLYNNDSAVLATINLNEPEMCPSQIDNYITLLVKLECVSGNPDFMDKIEKLIDSLTLYR